MFTSCRRRAAEVAEDMQSGVRLLRGSTVGMHASTLQAAENEHQPAAGRDRILTSLSLSSGRLSWAMRAHSPLQSTPGGGSERTRKRLNSCGRVWQAAQKICRGGRV